MDLDDFLVKLMAAHPLKKIPLQASALRPLASPFIEGDRFAFGE